MKLDYVAPPDLLNRFVETPWSHLVEVQGKCVEVFSVEPLDRYRASEQRGSVDWRWWFIPDDRNAEHGKTILGGDDLVATVMRPNNVITILDRQLGLAFSFYPDRLPVQDVVCDELSWLLHEYLL